jgi:hypothetical protein
MRRNGRAASQFYALAAVRLNPVFQEGGEQFSLFASRPNQVQLVCFAVRVLDVQVIRVHGVLDGGIHFDMDGLCMPANDFLAIVDAVAAINRIGVNAPDNCYDIAIGTQNSRLRSNIEFEQFSLVPGCRIFREQRRCKKRNAHYTVAHQLAFSFLGQFLQRGWFAARLSKSWQEPLAPARCLLSLEGLAKAMTMTEKLPERYARLKAKAGLASATLASLKETK